MTCSSFTAEKSDSEDDSEEDDDETHKDNLDDVNGGNDVEVQQNLKNIPNFQN